MARTALFAIVFASVSGGRPRPRAGVDDVPPKPIEEKMEPKIEGLSSLPTSGGAPGEGWLCTAASRS